MPQTIEALRLFQWGKEVTRGTGVVATSKIAVENIEFDPQDKVERPPLAKGLLHRYPGAETVITRGTVFRVPSTPWIYDQGQNWCGLAIKGGVTPTGVGPYTWAFPSSLTADPAPDTVTIERRLTDGTSPKDTKWLYGFLTQLKWEYRIDQPLKFSAEGVARRVQANTLTAALAMPNIEIPPVPLAKLWIDSTWAALGTTQVVGQIVSADVTFRTGLKPKLTFDGRTDLDFTTYVLDAKQRGLDVEIKMLVSGQYDAEKTAAEAQTARAARLDIIGTSSRELKLDMLLKHDIASVFAVTQEDGQDLVTLKLVDTDDGTNMFAATVVNQVATWV